MDEDRQISEDRKQAAGPLTRAEASAAVSSLGWRYLLGVARTCVDVRSLSHAAGILARLDDEVGADGERLLIDVRPGFLARLDVGVGPDGEGFLFDFRPGSLLLPVKTRAPAGLTATTRTWSGGS